MPVDFSHPNAQPFLLEAGDCALLLIHGFTGSPGHMRPVGEAVHAAGFTVRGIALPGHCQSIEAMEQSDWKQWLACCRDAMRQMQAKYRRVSVGGLSMGGILSLLMAEEFSPASVVLFAPALKYKRAANKLSPLAKHFIRVLDWGEPNRGLDFLNEYDYGYRGAPVRKVEDMTRLQTMARKGLRDVTCPALVIQSHRDESVHRDTPEIIMRGVSSQVKEICWVDRSAHVCTIGPDRAYVNARVIDFLRRYGV
ncbi:MAG: alpha/beta fold hydrolase [Christensenellales bacterium]|uniref:Alpha/beta fold hydrolase n=1 Tax=Candidatus Avichristensenella intestinipullorum TaxID=2840693 RepID=A0A9D1CIA3_9FIRM|nr:alpha/beta fold hydrolase [Christensenellales bacterium]HIQ62901.1 alpha/beta fold hydrolase [Candidatus Avichristensenella intestinipullorum]